MVVNAHIDEVVSLQMVRGNSYEKILAFYEYRSQGFARRNTDSYNKKESPTYNFQ